MSDLLPLAEAQARLLSLAAPLECEQVPIQDAAGSYLGEPIHAARTQPPADLSAMDGYALRVGESGPWSVIGESAAGHPFAGTVGPRQAIRISTGALMPAGANAVLLQENANREGDTLALSGEGKPTERHIRRAGFDFKEGDLLLPAGTLLGPTQHALAIASGATSAATHRLPNVSILDSGDELARPGEPCTQHQIPASNGAMLDGMCRNYTAAVSRFGPIADDLGALGEALERGSAADVIVTSGGASVGDHDLIRPALEAWGAQIDFWKVAIRPGKPLLVARKGKQIVLALPGNPVSSFVTAYLFLLPLLRKLAGATNPLPQTITLPLDGSLPDGGQRTEFVRAVVSNGKVAPLVERDSSALRSLAIANALIERPTGCSTTGHGSAVPVYLLENGGIA
jgi:molybdopterin molybdotransferase